MGEISNSGCAVRQDNSLKDASEIVWTHDKDDDQPIAPPMPHPFFTNQSRPTVIVAGSRRSGRAFRPSARVTDPDNAMNKGSSSTSVPSATIKRKAPVSVPSRRVSQKICVGSDDGRASETDPDDSSACPPHDGSDTEGTDRATDEFDVLEAMADADHKVCCLVSL
jgi:hypothetical protein